MRRFASRTTDCSAPIGFSVAGRVIQTLQYGVILVAVGGILTPTSALVTEGIHLVGAGLGDMVPNQVGITEGAYRVFASALGLEDAPARAISIALVARLCQSSLAAAALAACSAWGVWGSKSAPKGPDAQPL